MWEKVAWESVPETGRLPLEGNALPGDGLEGPCRPGPRGQLPSSLPRSLGTLAISVNSMPTGYGSEYHLCPLRKGGSVLTLLNDYLIIIWSPLMVFLYFQMFSFF